MHPCCQARPAIHCLVPPYILERMLESPNPQVRSQAIRNIAAAAAFRAARKTFQAAPMLGISASPLGGLHRQIYTAAGGAPLPGRLVRNEGAPPSADPVVNQAYDHSGTVYDFFLQVLGRNSLDGEGMSLLSSVHVPDEAGEPLNNAFWDGTQMAYGDGDGVLFRGFASALEVVGHELTHGVTSFSSNLHYHGQSGALNEHFSDVFGVVIRHWRTGQDVAQASWLVGDTILVTAPTRRALRDMAHPGTAFRNDPDLGDDPQPAHLSALYRGQADYGGVHINSGIPNRAFVLAARAIGGPSWGAPARIWYDTLCQLSANAQFADCARISRQIARASDAAHGQAVDEAWKAVGL